MFIQWDMTVIFGEHYRTTRLPIKDGTSRTVLEGIYKCRRESWYHFFYTTSDATLKLKTDSTFEFMELRDEGDMYDAIYHTGRWRVKQDTIVCEAVPELYPPSVQERYSGQVLHFVGGGWETDRQKAAEKGKIYKFLI